MNHPLILIALSLNIAGCVMPVTEADETEDVEAISQALVCPGGCIYRGVCVASNPQHCGTDGGALCVVQ